jgi:hypothetical protein
MNERNVEALTKLILEEWTATVNILESLPGFLASRGVLVPSALTDEDANRIETEAEDRMFLGPEEVRATLERIAKGET